MKKTIFTLMLLMSAVLTAGAQTTFNDAIKDYVRSCPAVTQSMTGQYLSLCRNEYLKTINLWKKLSTLLLSSSF